mmetsp:Transcript_54876/g.164239  ORF Transcript_54876/g.164239 Transcript_54876/m.164239 type:complete len:1097 (-) Transcript_54876:416-3706(-)
MPDSRSFSEDGTGGGGGMDDSASPRAPRPEMASSSETPAAALVTPTSPRGTPRGAFFDDAVGGDRGEDPPSVAAWRGQLDPPAAREEGQHVGGASGWRQQQPLSPTNLSDHAGSTERGGASGRDSAGREDYVGNDNGPSYVPYWYRTGGGGTAAGPFVVSGPARAGAVLDASASSSPFSEDDYEDEIHELVEYPYEFYPDDDCREEGVVVDHNGEKLEGEDATVFDEDEDEDDGDDHRGAKRKGRGVPSVEATEDESSEGVDRDDDRNDVSSDAIIVSAAAAVRLEILGGREVGEEDHHGEGDDVRSPGASATYDHLAEESAYASALAGALARNNQCRESAPSTSSSGIGWSSSSRAAARNVEMIRNDAATRIQAVQRGRVLRHSLLVLLGIAKRRKWEHRTKSALVTRVHSDMRRAARSHLRDRSAELGGGGCMVLAVLRVCAVRMQRWWRAVRWRSRRELRALEEERARERDMSRAEMEALRCPDLGVREEVEEEWEEVPTGVGAGVLTAANGPSAYGGSLLEDGGAAMQAEAAAVAIQAFVRGSSHRRWYVGTVLPSIVLVQSHARAFAYRRLYAKETKLARSYPAARRAGRRRALRMYMLTLGGDVSPEDDDGGAAVERSIGIIDGVTASPIARAESPRHYKQCNSPAQGWASGGRSSNGGKGPSSGSPGGLSVSSYATAVNNSIGPGDAANISASTLTYSNRKPPIVAKERTPDGVAAVRAERALFSAGGGTPRAVEKGNGRKHNRDRDWSFHQHGREKDAKKSAPTRSALGEVRGNDAPNRRLKPVGGGDPPLKKAHAASGEIKGQLRASAWDELGGPRMSRSGGFGGGNATDDEGVATGNKSLLSGLKVRRLRRLKKKLSVRGGHHHHHHHHHQSPEAVPSDAPFPTPHRGGNDPGPPPSVVSPNGVDMHMVVAPLPPGMDVAVPPSGSNSSEAVCVLESNPVLSSSCQSSVAGDDDDRSYGPPADDASVDDVPVESTLYDRESEGALVVFQKGAERAQVPARETRLVPVEWGQHRQMVRASPEESSSLALPPKRETRIVLTPEASRISDSGHPVSDAPPSRSSSSSTIMGTSFLTTQEQADRAMEECF